MVAINESATYETEITRIEPTDVAEGGDETKTPNKQLKQLANRTKYLKTERDKLPVVTVDSEGAAQVGNSEVEVTSGGKTTTVPAHNLHVQMESVVEHLTKHRGTTDSEYRGDHDARYPRVVAAFSRTLAADELFSSWQSTPPHFGNPPLVAAYYTDSGVEYMAGTGPRAADLQVIWDNANYESHIKNVGATSLDVRIVVYSIQEE